MPRASGATSKASAPTPGSSSARCRSRRSTTSRACRRPSPSSRSTSGHTPRSTVGTVTEIYDYLRILHVAAGPAVLPGLRHADRHAVGRRDHRQDHGPAGRHEALPDGPAGNPRRRAVRNAVGRDSRASGYVRDARRRPDVLGRRAAGDRPPAQARRRGGDRPRDGSPRRPLADRRQRGERPVAGHAACCTWPIPRDDVPEPQLADRDPQPALRLRPLRAELRAAHAAQLLVQQLAGLVPGLRRAGHADRRESGGAAARSEADAGRGRGGAVARRRAARCSPRCSTALSRARGVPLDVPFEQLSGRASPRRSCTARASSGSTCQPRRQGAKSRRAGRCSASNTRASIRRWKKPAATVARASAAKLEHLVDEVECSTCGGSRLRDDAAAVRLRGRTIDELCRLPLGELLDEFKSWKLDRDRAEDRRRSAAARSATGCNSWSTWAWTT